MNPPTQRSLHRRHVRSVLSLFAALLLTPVLARAQVDTLDTLPDFKVDLVMKANRVTNGTWISMGKDNKGRLLLGGQRGQPLTRLTLGADGKVEKEEILKLPVTEIMGSLWAFDSLYVNGSNGKKFGMFRLTEKADGTFSSELLREFHGGEGEHGAHGIVLGPDQKLYTVCGNFVDVPQDILPTSPHRNYADDLILPRAEDGNGFGSGKKPPGGFILRMDKDGKNAELFASGQRNTYDIAFNGDGELLGFDSDMEWDWGTAWYRPIRPFHAVSGGDSGFREGTAKYPTYYFDSLPPVTNVGVGSPTGVVFGTGAKFPAKYQKAFYMLDWSYGRVIAVHLTPDGASYTGTWENLVAPKGMLEKGNKAPNNVTDIVIGDDGALYFTTGGRGTPGNLYRVTYTGKESTAAADVTNKEGAPARTLRHELETFHNAPNPKAIETAWPHLASPDRFIRYAARIAIERQPVDEWKKKALEEKNLEASLTALLALARYGDKSTQPELLAALELYKITQMTEQQQLEKIRVIEVSYARQGKPEAAAAAKIVAELSPLYPAKAWPLNRELCQTLIALDAPDAISKTVKLLDETNILEEQVGYVLYLRVAKTGWTPELQKEYFTWWTKDHGKTDHLGDTVKWFEDAGRPYSDGASFPNFLSEFHSQAEANLSAKDKESLADVLSAYTPPGAKPRPKPMKKHVFVKSWTMEELEPLVKEPLKGRNFDSGKEAFVATQCMACHVFGKEGGAVGPDLTAVASRFNRHDILESIIEPSKVISEQYQQMEVRTKDGDVVTGRILEETADKLVVMPNPLKPNEKVEVKKADFKSRKPSKLSPMPQGLVDILTKDEVLDLLAYVESGGNKDHPDFKKK